MYLIKQIEVKGKTNFQCVRCRAFGVEIHHLKPVSLGGIEHSIQDIALNDLFIEELQTIADLKND